MLHQMSDATLKQSEVIYFLFQHLNSAIDYERDFGYEYFGFRTLERSYLLKINGKGIVQIVPS